MATSGINRLAVRRPFGLHPPAAGLCRRPSVRKAAEGILERDGYTGLVRVAVSGETRVPLRRPRRGARGATIW
jgi:hypothetical protein